MNMNDKKTKRIIAGVIAVIMALAMVVPSILYYLILFIVFEKGWYQAL